MRPQLFRQRNGTFVPEKFRFGVQPSSCTDVEQAKACTACETVGYFKVVGREFSLQAELTLSRLKPELHARYGVQPSGCTDVEQAKACTPCQTVGYFKVVGMEFSLQAALTLSRLKPVLQTRWLSGVGELLIYDLGKSIGGWGAGRLPPVMENGGLPFTPKNGRTSGKERG